jgi:Invasion associated locus B (IalB) protein
MLSAPAHMGCVMIRAFLPRLALAALLSAASSIALAQQAQEPPAQRSRTVTQPRQQAPAQPSQQRNAAGAQQKPAPSGTTAKPAAAPAKPTAGQAKPTPGQAKPTPGQAKPAAAQAKPAPQSGTKPAGSAAGPGGANAAPVATFNDWKAYVAGQGRTKLCYALAAPQERLPKDLKRDPAYLFVSFRPADNVRNEIAIVMGFATKENGPGEALVGTTRFALVTKGLNAWVENPAEESQVVAAFTRGKAVTVKATSARGNPTTDNYSLSGFAQALERARKECS